MCIIFLRVVMRQSAPVKVLNNFRLEILWHDSRFNNVSVITTKTQKKCQVNMATISSNLMDQVWRPSLYVHGDLEGVRDIFV
jgi:hypothetical protein